MAAAARSIKNRLLANLAHDELEQLCSDMLPVYLAQREVVYEIGATIEHVYFMEEGVAAILTTMADGASVEVAMIGREGMVGVAALLGDKKSA